MSNIEYKQMNNKGEVKDVITFNPCEYSKSDPLAFGYGVSQGLQNRGKKLYVDKFKETHGSNYRELSKEYLRGFKFGYLGILLPEGTKIPKGTEATYYDIEKMINK